MYNIHQKSNVENVGNISTSYIFCVSIITRGGI
nr:MAG TPA: hypothetical protein [Caudoviricetes sp.]